MTKETSPAPLPSHGGSYVRNPDGSLSLEGEAPKATSKSNPKKEG